MNETYDYILPEEFIANKPAEPRDSAKLFVFNSKDDSVHFDIFSNITDHLPSPALIVLNETKVVPARVELTKETGGKVDSLFLMNEWKGGDDPLPVIVNKKLAIGTRVYAESANNKYFFEVIGQNENIFHLKPLFDDALIQSILHEAGKTPIPKYIKGLELEEDDLRRRYQTVFANDGASVAAPTASLHFTENVLNKLNEKGINVAKVSLHVGLGTFAPVSENNLKSGTLHSERYLIRKDQKELIRKAKEQGVPIIAVGTTVVRTLESAAVQILEKNDADIHGETNIFIKPPYDFKIADILVTNFHVPKSSLMMLVQAFLGFKGTKTKLVKLYEKAKENNFRFYSFGDSMLIK